MKIKHNDIFISCWQSIPYDISEFMAEHPEASAVVRDLQSMDMLIDIGIVPSRVSLECEQSGIPADAINPPKSRRMIGIMHGISAWEE